MLILRRLFLVLILLSSGHIPYGTSAVASASPEILDELAQVNPSAELAAIAHGDNFPLEATYEAPPPLTEADWWAIPIKRSLTNGNYLLSFGVINKTSARIDISALQDAGTPLFPVSEIHQLSRSLREQISLNETKFRELTEQHLTDDGGERLSQEQATLSSTTRVTVYYDNRIMRDESHILPNLDQAWRNAAVLLSNDAGITLDRWFIQDGELPIDDVRSDCDLQEIARFEQNVASRERGDAILLFSVEKISYSGGAEPAYGYTMDHPIANPLRFGDYNNVCAGSRFTPRIIPSAYVGVDSSTLNSVPTVTEKPIVDYHTAHELGHIFNMLHKHGWCGQEWFYHVHKTVEVATSDQQGVPSNCGSYMSAWSHYHWDFADNGVTAMQSERNAWITCLQHGWCPSGSTPSAVNDLTAVAGPNLVTLSWAAPAHTGGGPFDSYYIYRSQSPDFQSNSHLHREMSPTTTTFLDTQVVSGQTYWYYVRASNAIGQGPKGEEVSATPHKPSPPGNDNFADAATSAANPFTTTQPTSYATTEPGEPNPCGSIGHTVWFKYTPPSDGPYEITTEGSNFDTVVAAYTGDSISALVPLKCNDEAGGGTGWSKISDLQLKAGNHYYIQIGGYAANAGTLSVRISGTSSNPPPSPPNQVTLTGANGIGTGYDNAVDRGKYFPSGVPTGTVSSVCAYAQAGNPNGVTVALKEQPGSSNVIHTTNIPIQAAGWNCVTANVPWTATSLFVHRTSGDAYISYNDVGTGNGDSYAYSPWNGWQLEDNYARGYKVTVQT